MFVKIILADNKVGKIKILVNFFPYHLFYLVKKYP